MYTNTYYLSLLYIVDSHTMGLALKRKLQPKACVEARLAKQRRNMEHKGIQTVLAERGLWPTGRRFVLEYTQQGHDNDDECLRKELTWITARFHGARKGGNHLQKLWKSVAIWSCFIPSSILNHNFIKDYRAAAKRFFLFSFQGIIASTV